MWFYRKKLTLLTLNLLLLSNDETCSLSMYFESQNYDSIRSNDQDGLGTGSGHGSKSVEKDGTHKKR